MACRLRTATIGDSLVFERGQLSSGTSGDNSEDGEQYGDVRTAFAISQALASSAPGWQSSGVADAYVLVVDDDADIRETIVAVLEAYGYRGKVAGDGAEALAFLRMHRSRPGLILLDLMMPNMNGIEFRRAQLADPALADIPVVLMTGAPMASGDPALAGLALLVKPVALKTILSHVERHMARPEVNA